LGWVTKTYSYGKKCHDASNAKVKLSPCAQDRTLTLQQVEALRTSRQTEHEGGKIRRKEGRKEINSTAAPD